MTADTVGSRDCCAGRLGGVLRTSSTSTCVTWRPDLDERLLARGPAGGGRRHHSGRRAGGRGGCGLRRHREPPSPTLERLGRLDLPILLVVASDTVGTEHGRRALERFRTEVPHAKVVELDSGHDLLADRPDETISAVGGWLQRSVA